MSDGELCAYHYQTGRPVVVRWQQGTITSVNGTEREPDRNIWIAPPLVDLQINGYAGVDFQQDDLSLEDLVRARNGLVSAGCATWFLTLITDEWPRMMQRLKHLRQLRARSPALQAAIAGWHIEGPFLSAEQGYAGAHNPEVMCDPTPDHIRELRDLTDGDRVLLTVAPERLEAISAIALAHSLGIRVSLGHTNAPSKRITQAIRAGAASFTHLGNGCPRLLDRHDNILWRLFEIKGLKVGLIPDAVHVSAPLFRIVHRNVGADSIYYTSDAMAAAGAPPGRYTLGRLQLDVGEDRIVRNPGSPLFAGSALEPINGVFRAAEMLDASWRTVWERASDVPSRLVSLPLALAPGQPATFCVLRVTPENWFEDFQAYVGGLMVEV